MRVLVGLLAAATLSVITAVPATAAPPTPASALEWSGCGDGLECATARVPLDHRRPRGATLDLALVRRPATDRARRIGSLFLNPGGPGGSGVALVRAGFTGLSDEVHARFDVIGFDPRGIGGSTNVRCFTDTARQRAVLGGLPRIPVGHAEEQHVRRGQRQFTEHCERNAGRLVAHLGTADVARDLDLLREAVGDRRLTYVGYSYGSFIGQVYANLFGHRVRALVLDGVVDPVLLTGDGTALAARNAASAEDALDSFTERCTAGTGCALATPGTDAAAPADADAIRGRVDALVAAVRAAPFPAPSANPPGELTYSVAVNTLLTMMYDPFFWGELATALAATERGDGSALLTLARDFGIPDAAPFDPSAPYRNADDAFASVICADSAFPDASRWPTMARTADERSPVFGRRWLYRVLPCATWPAESAPGRYTGPWDRPTAAPLLVVGTTRDAATPLSSARRVAGLLDDAGLLVHDGYGHTSINDPSTCARNAIADYLVDRTLPPTGTVCRGDTLPFS